MIIIFWNLFNEVIDLGLFCRRYNFDLLFGILTISNVEDTNLVKTTGNSLCLSKCTIVCYYDDTIFQSNCHNLLLQKLFVNVGGNVQSWTVRDIIPQIIQLFLNRLLD